MQNLDLSTIAVFAAAGLSLLAQIYLFVTWPRKSSQMEPQLAGFSNETLRSANSFANHVGGTQGLPGELAGWKAPSAESLDGILADAPTVTRPAGTRRRRSKRKDGPATTQLRIVRAGIYRKGGIRTFQISRIVITVTAFLAGFLIIPFTNLPWVFGALAGAFTGLAGYLAPSFWLDSKLKKRQTTMRRALPDALDLITVCLQGGLSLPAALSRVARELAPAHPLLATELAIVEREIQMGRSTGNAMLQFASRFDLEELRSLSSVIGQTEKYGGTIAGALKTFAESLRVRRKQKAEEMAQQAAVKLLFPTLFCIFPGIFVVILGPTAVRMMQVMSGISFGN